MFRLMVTYKRSAKLGLPFFRTSAYSIYTKVLVQENNSGFKEMVSGYDTKYFMVGGKGGVGKTSCAASLAVKFADNGHRTMVISTDPAHSLSDSFSQDLSGGNLIHVEGTDSPLFALELNLQKAKEELSEACEKDDGSHIKALMKDMGLGSLANQLGDLNFEELLEKPPPGIDEVMAISKVMDLVESNASNAFSRVVFDTAPTGHTLHLLSLPDFMDSSLSKMMKLKSKLTSATSALKCMFGKKSLPEEDTNGKLERLKMRLTKVRNLFQDPSAMEFLIVTIPTIMAIHESSRLCSSLVEKKVHVRNIIVNQVLPPSTAECKFCSVKRKDQERALEILKKDAELGILSMIQAPLFDAEIRGIPALKFMGDVIWR